MKPRIVVDVMGADRPPAELARGAIQASAKLPLTLVLAARRRDLPPDLPPTIEVLECPQDEGEGSSIARGIAAVGRGEAEAFLSAGSTGAV
ncbi:MAG TPA: phosphate acyltransferase, partial [Candidatus Acetothermia bacterium]|nr:phosphate acyltransferase [Candidatus Acetothermia bacterium]